MSENVHNKTFNTEHKTKQIKLKTQVVINCKMNK